MTAPIVSVAHLSKRYTLCHKQGGYRTLRDTLAETARSMLGRNGIAAPAAHEEFWALKDVSFEINRGDVVGIIGRNGAGKSTLLKILSRITEPTSGTIRLGGRVASLLEVGTGFHPELTGRENIFLNGAILGMTKAEIRSKFDEIVAFAEVEKFLDTPVKHYSSGMYVRLAFAVAAHLDPEILVVDEVLAVGDVAFQKKCMGKMRDVAEHGGRTILFVSHNMGAIGTLCSTAILLKSGQVEKHGAAEDVLAVYMESLLEKSDIDLAALRWPGSGTDIRITSLSMADDANMLDYEDPLRIDISVESERDFEGLSIGSTVFTSQSEPVGSLFTTDTFAIGRGEKKTLRLFIEGHRLAPGTYYLGFSVGTGGIRSERFDYDIVIGAPPFTIAARDATGMLASWHRTWGPVHFGNTRLEALPAGAHTRA